MLHAGQGLDYRALYDREIAEGDGTFVELPEREFLVHQLAHSLFELLLFGRRYFFYD